MTVLKMVWILIVLLCGCDSTSPSNNVESTLPETELNKDRNKLVMPKEDTDHFRQDLNKSYNDVKHRWIHAVPLHEYNESNLDIR
jgi:hypothetical protein